MALSPNYQWAEPDNSSLVKNGAADIRTLGDAIDTSVWNVGYGQAGKNKFINGDFGIWQRGTSTSTDNGFAADRWCLNLSGATASFSQQSFTIGQTDVLENPTYFGRLAVTTGNNACRIEQRLEDVTKTSGQTFTVSFWAKGTNPAGGNLDVTFRQVFGSGGSASVDTFATPIVLTASWQRFTRTVTFPSVTGKTIGAGNWYGIDIRQPLGDTGVAAWTLDIANAQLEYGSKATPFQTASGGSLQAELAMCQRYYYRTPTPSGSSDRITIFGTCTSTTECRVNIQMPVQMRIAPTAVDYANLRAYDGAGFPTVTSLSLGSLSPGIAEVITVGTGYTAFRPTAIANNTNGYIGLSAEL